MAAIIGYRSHKFFRLTLLSGNADNIEKMLRDMERDVERIETDIAQVVYYMNGGLSYTDAWSFSSQQLLKLSQTISNHFERQADSAKKTQSNRRST